MLTCLALIVISLHTVLKQLDDEFENPDSILNRTGASKSKELGLLAQSCNGALQQLNKLLIKYKSLGTKSKRAWDLLRWVTENLTEIREKIISHTSSLTLCLTTLGTGSLGRIEKKLDELIADVRAGRREETVLSMADNDEDEGDTQWSLWKDELMDDGFTKAELESHKHWIKARLAELIESGDLCGESSLPYDPTSTAPTFSLPFRPEVNVSKHLKQPKSEGVSTKCAAFQPSVEEGDNDDEIVVT